jgi:hypothetical protein
MALGAGSDPHAVMNEELSRDQYLRDAWSRKGRDAARLEAGCGENLVGTSDTRAPGSGSRRDFLLVGTAVAGNQRERRATVTDEEQRLDNLRT